MLCLLTLSDILSLCRSWFRLYDSRTTSWFNTQSYKQFLSGTIQVFFSNPSLLFLPLKRDLFTFNLSRTVLIVFKPKSEHAALQVWPRQGWADRKYHTLDQLATLCLTQPSMLLLSFPWGCFAGLWSTCFPPGPQGPNLQSCFPVVWSLVCVSSIKQQYQKTQFLLFFNRKMRMLIVTIGS